MSGARVPERAGDGLVVSVRPFNGRLRRAQADGLAAMAAAHGNGILDLSADGALRVRGVREDSHAALVSGLEQMGLLDATEADERRRRTLVTPFWQTGGETETLSAALTEALAGADLPDLPDGFTFAVDSRKEPVLQRDRADIRLERDAGGGLILVADGAERGKPVTVQSAVDEMLALARRFAEGDDGATRMAERIARDGSPPDGHFVPRQRQGYAPAPGYTPIGAIVGLALGQMLVDTLAALAKHGGMRMTPWGLLLVENARQLPTLSGVVTDGSDPLWRVVACSGAARCPRGHVETRPLGREIAPHVPAGSWLHLSGCVLGCAHRGPAPLCVTATPGGLDLIREGSADARPEATGLTPDAVIRRM